jgi:predicted RNA-binding Zn ribbon-like protein
MQSAQTDESLIADIQRDRDYSGLALLGGRLCLNFVNTVEPRHTTPVLIFLKCYGDLISWSTHAEALTPDEAALIRAAAARRPREAEATFHDALRIREAIYSIFAATLDDRPADPSDLATFNAALARALANLQIMQSDEHFAWRFAGEPDALDRMLWPILRSAAELLTSESLHRVRACGGCGWLFLDTSKNHSRRWCSMDACGNQAKARRHYRRRTGKAAEA